MARARGAILKDDVARLGNIGCMLNGAERSRFRARIRVVAADSNMKSCGVNTRTERERCQHGNEETSHFYSLFRVS